MAGEMLAVALGLLVGLSLGALGGGGSTLAVPVLVFVAGLQAQDATTVSLMVVGVASAFGVLHHFRNGNVRLGAGVAFGAAGIVGSRIGLVVNRSLDEQLLLLAFSALIAFVAFRMMRSADRSPQVPSLRQAEREGGEAGRLAVKERIGSKVSVDLSVSGMAKLAGAATGVGLLTGLFGVGGGFAVVPALTLLLKFPTRQAIGTSLVVIAINAAIALAMRGGDVDVDWALVGPFLATVTIGVAAGTHLASGVETARLTHAFALMLGVVAIYTATSTLFWA